MSSEVNLSRKGEAMVNDDAFRQSPVDNPYYAPQAAPPESGTYISRSERTLNPWTSIWLRPRVTIRQIVETDPNYMVLVLAAGGGIGRALGEISDMVNGAELPLSAVLGRVAIGALVGVVTIFFAGWLIRWTASWLGGIGTSQQTRAALAWGQLPMIVEIPIVLTLVVLFGIDVFEPNSPNTELQSRLWPLMVIGGGLMAVLSFWSFFSVLKCVAEVHQFSAWRALGALFLASATIFFTVVLPIMLFGVVAGIAGGVR